MELTISTLAAPRCGQQVLILSLSRYSECAQLELEVTVAGLCERGKGGWRARVPLAKGA